MEKKINESIYILENEEDKQKYLKQLKVLWKECFGDTKEFIEYYFEWKLKSNKIYVCLDNDKLVSMLHLNPYYINIRGKKEKLYYIVGVGTKETYRRRGLMRSLITRALNDLYKEGNTFSYLMPAKEDIYIPFDFRYIYRQNQLSFNCREASISISACSSNPLESFNKSFKEAQELSFFAEGFLKNKYDIYTCHDMEYFMDIGNQMEGAGGEIVFLHDDRGKIKAYAAFMLEKDTAEVVEIITDKDYSEEFHQYLKEYLYKKADTKDLQIKYSDVSFLGGNENDMTQILEKPVIMGRAIDCRELFKLLRSDRPYETIIKVNDSIIKENNKVYKLDVRKNECIVYITDKEPDREIDIWELTGLVMKNMNICINEIV